VSVIQTLDRVSKLSQIRLSRFDQDIANSIMVYHETNGFLTEGLENQLNRICLRYRKQLAHLNTVNPGGWNDISRYYSSNQQVIVQKCLNPDEIFKYRVVEKDTKLSLATKAATVQDAMEILQDIGVAGEDGEGKPGWVRSDVEEEP